MLFYFGIAGGFAAFGVLLYFVARAGYEDAVNLYRHESIKSDLYYKTRELGIEHHFADLVRVIDNNWDSVERLRSKGKIDLEEITTTRKMQLDRE